MAMTKAIRDDLAGELLAHDGQSSATITRTGMLKTKRGLIIQPSEGANDTHTGPLDSLTQAERSAYRMDEIDAMHRQQEAQETPAVVEHGQRGRRRKPTGQGPLPAPEPVLLNIVLPGIGTIPSQYSHCHQGTGVLVLGMNKYSYRPAQATAGGSGLQGVLEITRFPGVRYVYAGHAFKDADGVENIILMEVPQDYHEDDDNDGQEE